MAQSCNVEIQGMLFRPDSVTLATGDTVEWLNKDGMSHTVTADDGSTFSSGPIGQGKSFRHVFAAPGSFGYFCEIHPDMVGTVIVS